MCRGEGSNDTLHGHCLFRVHLPEEESPLKGQDDIMSQLENGMENKTRPRVGHSGHKTPSRCKFSAKSWESRRPARILNKVPLGPSLNIEVPPVFGFICTGSSSRLINRRVSVFVPSSQLPSTFHLQLCLERSQMAFVYKRGMSLLSICGETLTRFIRVVSRVA